jgi:proteasome lid subunit RPN8/RPN11
VLRLPARPRRGDQRCSARTTRTACTPSTPRRTRAPPRTATTSAAASDRFASSFDSDDPPTIIYHSHPRVGAYFSAEDERAALAAGWPVDYLVVDVQDDGVRESVLFRRDPERAPRRARVRGDRQIPG